VNVNNWEINDRKRDDVISHFILSHFISYLMSYLISFDLILSHISFYLIFLSHISSISYLIFLSHLIISYLIFYLHYLDPVMQNLLRNLQENPMEANKVDEIIEWMVDECELWHVNNVTERYLSNFNSLISFLN